LSRVLGLEIQGRARIERDADRERQRRHELLAMLALFVQLTRAADDAVFVEHP